MNYELFIAKRLYKGLNRNKKQLSKPIVIITQISIALGVAVMLISISVSLGFKREIKRKTSGFNAHIQIVNLDLNKSYETKYIFTNKKLEDRIKALPYVVNVQKFSTKASVLKSKVHVEGVILKGVDSNYNFSFFKENLISGNIPDFKKTEKSNKILISKRLTQKLGLNLGDTLKAYFIQKHIRLRKFVISGIFNTGMAELDKTFAFIDLKHIQKLNSWKSNQISGYEIILSDFSKIDEVKNEIKQIIGYKIYKDKPNLKVQTIKDKYPLIFEWISLFDTNVWVILILVSLVAGFNMISGLLVIVLENTKTIGILKTIGTKNKNIKKVFLYFSAIIIIKAFVWGNVIAFLLLLSQYFFNIIPLDPESYYINTVPVSFPVIYFILLNIGGVALTTLMMVIPSTIIAKINPGKVIRFN